MPISHYCRLLVWLAVVKSFDKQVELICERAERRLSKQQAWIRWCPEVETQEEAAAPAQAAGAYDPEKQEANWIISRVPRKSYQRMTGSSLPARDKRIKEYQQQR